MKIIFTTEDKKTARKSIDSFRQSYLIDAREIILEFDYSEGQVITSPHDFIINKELEKRLYQAIINKKSQQVVYFHYGLSAIFIKNIKAFFKAHDVKPVYSIFDPEMKYKSIWKNFDEVIN